MNQSKEHIIMATNNNRRSSLDQDTLVIEGVQKHLMSQSFIVGDKPCTAQDVVNVFQSRITTGRAAVSDKAAWQAAVKADREQRAQTAVFVRAFRNIVLGMFHDPSTLADFGLSPRKSTKRTVATKSVAIAKNEATRKARSTMGKKQKAKVKGTPPATPSPGGATAKAPEAPKPTAP
jgi:hypothetical protein